MASWWLSYCFRCFLSLWESQNVRTHCQEVLPVWTGKT
jgi:hypothetical protein